MKTWTISQSYKNVFFHDFFFEKICNSKLPYQLNYINFLKNYSEKQSYVHIIFIQSSVFGAFQV